MAQKTAEVLPYPPVVSNVAGKAPPPPLRQAVTRRATKKKYKFGDRNVPPENADLDLYTCPACNATATRISIMLIDDKDVLEQMKGTSRADLIAKGHGLYAEHLRGVLTSSIVVQNKVELELKMVGA